MYRILILTASLVVTTKASHHFSYNGDSQLYPIHPKLISQSVQLKEVPTKIIKITKTVAVKVPVPYPVKVPHHIPVPVPVHQPVAIPVPQIVKVPHHVPVEVEKPVPVELHQQVPLYLSKPVPLPHPVPVPQPITINRPVYYPVPHAVPYPAHHRDEHAGEHVEYQHPWSHFSSISSYPQQHDVHASLYARSSDFEAKEEIEDHEDRAESQQIETSQNDIGQFRPSQPDYSNEH